MKNKYFNSEKENLGRNFKNLNLAQSKVATHEFEECLFSECDFSEAQLNNSKFIECQFTKCNLSLLQVTGCRFSDVVFEECKIVGVDWTKAHWPEFALYSPVKFYKSIINDSSFFGLNMVEVVIVECKAHDVDFREARLAEASFTYTDFAHSLFHNTDLSGADFTEATNYSIDIQANQIKHAKFSRLEAANLLTHLGIELVD